MRDERRLIVEYGKKISSSGLSPGTSGNLSIYNPEAGYMAISPSGIGYFETRPRDVVIMDLNANVIDGDRKPSSEWALHSEFYKHKPYACAVVHTHSIYCSAFAALRQPLIAVHYIIGEAGVSEIPCAEYRCFGTQELADAAIRACENSNAVLLANHGIAVCGRDIESAFSLAKNCEYLAKLQYLSMSIGSPNIISEEDMKIVMDKFKSYGQGGAES